MEIYFDNNATTQPLDQVREAMMDVLSSNFGNPSSNHSAGERGRSYLRQSRQYIAQLLSTDPDNIIFTSSGTESNNLALSSILKWQPNDAHLITTAIEHSSILKYCEHLESLGYEIDYLSVKRNGTIDVDKLQSKIRPTTRLISIQWVNNETGVIQPIEDIVRLCKSLSILLHTDAAQAVGKLDIKGLLSDLDYLSCTAHKIHGPQGIGALYVKEPSSLGKLIHGGGQERNLRAGTENLSGIVGFGKAAEIRHSQLENITNTHNNLRNSFEELLFTKVPDLSINGDINNRVANTSNILFHGVDGQALVARLDQEGLRCSQSSACTNMSPEPSYVLTAMGLSNDEAYSSVRFSFSGLNTMDEIKHSVELISSVVSQIREFSGYQIQKTLTLSEAV